jgi:hypothetical protein
MRARFRVSNPGWIRYQPGEDPQAAMERWWAELARALRHGGGPPGEHREGAAVAPERTGARQAVISGPAERAEPRRRPAGRVRARADERPGRRRG